MANYLLFLHHSFITKRGLKICADPEAGWVKAAIKSVDSKSTGRRNAIGPSPTGAQRSASTAMALFG